MNKFGGSSITAPGVDKARSPLMKNQKKEKLMSKLATDNVKITAELLQKMKSNNTDVFKIEVAVDKFNNSVRSKK